MMTALMVFIAIAFGLLLYGSLQSSIPDELSFLRSDVSPAASNIPGSTVQTFKGWRITQVGATVEATKEFNSGLALNNVPYFSPYLGLLCNENKLDVRIDVREPTTGIATSPVAINSEPFQEWDKGTGTNLFPKNASSFVRALTGPQQIAKLSFSYRNLGTQSAVLDTAGLSEVLASLPANCRP